MIRRPIRLLFVILVGTVLFLSVSEGRGDNGLAHQAIQIPPISLGTSGGNIYDYSRKYCCSGTLGALVQKGSSYYILSNNHVLARSNMGEGGEEIGQPGLIDYNCGAYQIVAHLSDFVPISFARRTTNVVDAAIAEIVPWRVKMNGDILDIGQISGFTIPPTIGLAVQKSGRTTGHTLGIIAAIDVTVSVKYTTQCGSRRERKATFVNQILINDAGFSSGGDSGSLVVTQETTPKALGLLFAGSETATVCNPIDDVLDALGISLVGTDSIAGGSSGFSAQMSATEVMVARAVKARHEEAIFAGHPAVCGVGIGRGADGRAMIQVYAERDLPSVRRAIPHVLEGISVEFIETGEIIAY
ncbi:MAG: hypothetical protein A2157_01375 [Deltaproteobacteria bacterium RBG_16_47_11]|nr:MAG: hypothetical protein A2157_01375 [Deltaproteobacteria bacterium RBG_16_47_11]